MPIPRGRSPTFTDLTTSSFGDVDDVHTVRLLGTDVEPFAVRTPHRVLRILAAHLDRAGDLERGRVDEHDLIVLLDRRGDPLAVR